MPIDSCDMTDIIDPTSQGGQSVDDLLEQAITCHQAWKFDEAEALYRSVLALEPGNADACHNLGVLLAIQLLRPVDALPYFEAALNLDSARGQYWFSYIDALIRADQKELAKSLLPIAQSMGVHMAMVNALAERLAETPQDAPLVPPPAAAPVVGDGAHMAPPEATGRPSKAEKKPKVRRAQEVPEAAQIEMVQLFRKRDWVAGEARARELIAQYPDSGFAWKSLGVMLHTQGKLDEALLAKRRKSANSRRDWRP